ncbi:putative amidohydrolase [Sphingomonas sp. BE270]|jgi:nitrilase|uniref:carbon-nitrogen hydrolase family protein n=1 Tax=unclassified Sphingomonas TaxID=196159 RepID=UPI00053D6088|nr:MULTISPECIES: carbon-nitrogen hydrolase family protein [unclassified Sphingomonas]MDR6847743.1 putative amidohydrolase [Sphingomonas sp. BE137]MDR7259214.1 putative amidohydrolase [Sphingomonas sp. BE270]RUN78461.1 carbon-nitrogen hydrolase family protein [Sphingomonas sp. TF3]
MSKTVKAALVQAAPIPLAIGDGITALLDHVADAADIGAQLVAFGETFLGGYPIWLDEAPNAALWDHRGTQALHAILLDQALRPDDPRLEPLQQLVDAANILVSVGAHERVRSSLTNTQYLFRPGLPPLLHRKLVPTHGERMIWGRGDGSTLDVHQAPWGTVGSLICWEHWMPLARAAMHHAGEAVHVAAWPTVRPMYRVASQHYAFEGRCFVLAAGLVQHRRDLLDGLDRVGGDADARDLILGIADTQLQSGGSCIIAPDGTLLAETGADPDLLIAELDLDAIGRGLTALDTDGHYARPDVFELRVDRRPRLGVADAEDGFAQG